MRCDEEAKIQLAFLFFFFPPSSCCLCSKRVFSVDGPQQVSCWAWVKTFQLFRSEPLREKIGVSVIINTRVQQYTVGGGQSLRTEP